MPHTETFIVSQNNTIRKATYKNSKFVNNPNPPKYVIEVFGYNHKEKAHAIKKMVDAAGMSDNLFRIIVNTRN
jgi:hypothetical protein